MINYITVAPCDELKEFVSHFWAARLSPEQQTHFIYYATANPNTELAFTFKPSTSGYPHLVFSSVLGHRAGFGQYLADSFVDIVGVSLFSYAVPLFLNVSASELINQFTDLDTLLGNGGSMIHEKMTSALTRQDYINVLSDYLQLQLSKKYFEDKLNIEAIQQIRRHCGIVTVTQLASFCCLSEKQFERRFSAYAGFTPKLYARIVRFESALWHSRQYDTFTKVAHHFGYYDQSHFIREFKTFTGLTPCQFFC